jgi:murein DD-endopeptidase MepM/ murein hydrolase activator NlpD
LTPSRKRTALAAAVTVTAIVMMLAGGCTPLRPGDGSSSVRSGPRGSGVYHTVRRGETLWRISKTYGVSLAEIMEANDLENYDIGVNQRLLIPGATRELSIKLPDASSEEVRGPSGEVRLAWPLAGRGRSSVTSRFGPRKSPGGGSTWHKGIDIDGVREERALAAAGGEVVFAGRMSGFGNVVMIDHGDRLITVYGHLSRSIVRLEERVSRGQTIGYVGSTGTATGSHLHFEVRYKGKSVDPLDYLP